MMFIRREGAIGDKIIDVGDHDLLRDWHHVQGCQHQFCGLDGAYAPGDATVADEACGFVGPFAVEVIDGVDESGRGGEVVFGEDEDEGVTALDDFAPVFGVVLGVVFLRRVVGLVEDGEVQFGEVGQGDVEAGGVLFREFVEPVGDGKAVAAGAGAGDNDVEVHGWGSCLRRGGVDVRGVPLFF